MLISSETFQASQKITKDERSANHPVLEIDLATILVSLSSREDALETMVP